MQKKKSSGSEKKRKHSKPEKRHGSKRRSSEANMEQQESKEEEQDVELDRIGSDIEEGGLDLSILFKPITAFICNRKEMLEQCFNVLGEKKLKKMLPDELKGCCLEEVRKLCWEQMELISDKGILQILAGDEVTSEREDACSEKASQSQQDNNVDSTSCLKAAALSEEAKQEGSGEESDVLSINADMCDSDIEGAREEPAGKPVGTTAQVHDPKRVSPPMGSQPPEPKKEMESDIDRSVSEILSSSKDNVKESSIPLKPAAEPVSSPPSHSSQTPSVCQPTLQQLELLELEMRARAIKALMKACRGQRDSADKNA
ncbi:caspase activity and apoptosis inhibitor 1 isoform X1 [Synchiropus splendidus]|uniref:caspase activity and apoptosis inhibitor 1 isoform X1 n=1 Tax=Synchiropus splendidus TaxID=270530 RepID=UPI00237DE74C|nr:caspase activity and apoptosis inhibitor 1 isoform X1 [Synchiropus splendidus]XP_053715679.1 caspase activity and apoptosis inhibitor 1 isoform X1 [Synchiropus splendidus]